MLESDRPWFKSKLRPFQALWPWPGDLTLLRLKNTEDNGVQAIGLCG